MSLLTDHYLRVTEEVRRAAERAGRRPDAVRVLAVSKTFPQEDIAGLYQCGCREFGESRIPELLAKAGSLPGDISWHMIGQLQANKVRKALGVAAWIHSVDSSSLLARMERIAGETGNHPAFLLEVNVSGETSKSGCTPDELPLLAEQAASCGNMSWRGLMTMAPEGASETVLHQVFGSLREWRDRLEKEFGIRLPELSMGMSGDWREAVAEGATIVRIGSAIFGHRNYSLLR